MKAIVQTRYGPPEVLELRDVDRPAVADHEVLVRVRASSIHPDIWHVVTGRPYVLRLLGAGFPRPKHLIPGTDVAGVIESVGTGVTQFELGDQVFGETTRAHQWINGGAYAEYVAVREDQVVLKPDNVTFEQAASVPTSGFIALQNLRATNHLGPGRDVLVNGAGGGTGSLALQYAKARGARVTAVDSTSKLEMLRSLGADEVVDYTREDFTRRGVRYDFVFDVPGNHTLSACKRVLKPEGKYVLIGHEGFGRSGKRFLGLFPHFFKLICLSFFVKELRLGRDWLPTRKEALEIWRDLLEAGKVKPIIDSTYPLSEIREALRHVMEDEIRGKVIVVPSKA